MVTSLTYTYTTQAEVERLYGKKGVAEITADLGGPNLAAAWEEVIADATTTIDAYAAQIYSPIDLANSYWVRERAKWIAAFRLSQRRGNNDLFSQRYKEIIEELERVKNFDIMIPGLPTSADLTPAMSNVYVDPRFSIAKLRVHPSISTGGLGSRQDVSWNYPSEWF